MDTTSSVGVPRNGLWESLASVCAREFVYGSAYRRIDWCEYFFASAAITCSYGDYSRLVFCFSRPIHNFLRAYLLGPSEPKT